MLKFSEVHVDVQTHHTVCIKYVQVFLHIKYTSIKLDLDFFLKNNKDINCISGQEK